MSSNRMGATLFELLIILSFVCVLASIALPSLRSALDGLAARAARETAFALLSRARVVALQSNGAEIHIDAARDYMAIRSPAGVIDREQHFTNVDLAIEGVSEPIVLRYDGHGIGRVMSRTIQFRHRSAAAGLTISSFGRVRRW
jgi:Tfp pilus assembly protein FimT